MTYDLNSAEKQTVPESHIPHGTIVPVHATLRPGGSGQDGWLRRSKNGDSLAMDFEFTVIEGKYARRKFWTLFTVEGETEGQQKAADISRSRLRAMLESARGVDPSDESERAVAARRVASLGDFDGLRFWAVVGLEKAKPDSGYKDKNFLLAVVTPDRKEWSKIDQAGPATGPAPAAAAQPAAVKASGSRPSWAA